MTTHTPTGSYQTLARRQRDQVRDALMREALTHAEAKMRSTAEALYTAGFTPTEVAEGAAAAGVAVLAGYALPYGRILAQEARERDLS